jgi:hypothetical protein
MHLERIQAVPPAEGVPGDLQQVALKSAYREQDI